MHGLSQQILYNLSEPSNSGNVTITSTVVTNTTNAISPNVSIIYNSIQTLFNTGNVTVGDVLIDVTAATSSIAAMSPTITTEFNITINDIVATSTSELVVPQVSVGLNLSVNAPPINTTTIIPPKISTKPYVEDGLQLYLNANGYSNPTSTWTDLTGNNNNGTLTNFAYTSASGWNSGELVTDGTDDFIGVPVGQYSQFTVETYVRLNKDYCNFIQYYGSSGIILYAQRNSGKYKLYINGYGTAFITNITSTTNTYEHISISVDKTITTNNIKLYKNGSLVYTGSGTVTATSDYLYLMGSNNPAYAMAGGIKIARFYNRVLTDVEVTQNYNDVMGIGGTDVTITSVAATNTVTAISPSITTESNVIIESIVATSTTELTIPQVSVGLNLSVNAPPINILNSISPTVSVTKPYVTDALQLYLNANGYSNPTSTWSDLSGNNNGTLTNFAYTSSSGWNGGELVTDGTDDFMYVAANADLKSYPMTIEFYVKVSSTYTANTLYGLYDNRYGNNQSSGGIELFARNGKLEIGGTTGAPTIAWNSTIADNTYHHLVVTISAQSSGTIKLYIDGTLFQTDTGKTCAVNNTTYRTNFLGNSSRAPIKSSCKIIRLYNKELTQEEVTQNYNDSISGTGTNVTITSVVMTNTLTAISPAVTAEFNVSISSIVATSTTELITPQTSTNVNASSVVLANTLTALIPSVSTSSVTNIDVSSIVMNGTVNSIAPNVNAVKNIIIEPTIINNEETILLPFISNSSNIEINHVAATSTIESITPLTSTGISLNINIPLINNIVVSISPTMNVVENINISPAVNINLTNILTPNVSSAGSVSVAPTVMSNSINSIIPAMITQSNITITSTANNTLTINTPSISTNINVNSVAMTNMLNSATPIISTIRNINIEPVAINNTVDTLLPIVSNSGNILIDVAKASSDIYATIPIIISELNTEINHTTANIVAELITPIVSTGGNCTINAPLISNTLTQVTPIVVIPVNINILNVISNNVVAKISIISTSTSIQTNSVNDTIVFNNPLLNTSSNINIQSVRFNAATSAKNAIIVIDKSIEAIVFNETGLVNVPMVSTSWNSTINPNMINVACAGITPSVAVIANVNIYANVLRSTLSMTNNTMHTSSALDADVIVSDNKSLISFNNVNIITNAKITSSKGNSISLMKNPMILADVEISPNAYNALLSPTIQSILTNVKLLPNNSNYLAIVNTPGILTNTNILVHKINSSLLMRNPNVSVRATALPNKCDLVCFSANPSISTNVNIKSERKVFVASARNPIVTYTRNININANVKNIISTVIAPVITPVINTSINAIVSSAASSIITPEIIARTNTLINDKVATSSARIITPKLNIDIHSNINASSMDSNIDIKVPVIYNIKNININSFVNNCVFSAMNPLLATQSNVATKASKFNNITQIQVPAIYGNLTGSTEAKQMFINTNYSLEIRLYFKETEIYTTYTKSFNIDLENVNNKNLIFISSIYDMLKNEIAYSESVEIDSINVISDQLSDYSLICEYEDLIVKVFAINNNVYTDNITAELYQDSSKIYLKILNFNNEYDYSFIINTGEPIIISQELTEITNEYGNTLAANLLINKDSITIKTIELSLALNSVDTDSIVIPVKDTNISNTAMPYNGDVYVNGVGMKTEDDLKINITDTIEANTFDLSIGLYGNKANSLTIYPKVQFDYNVAASYDRDYIAVVGDFDYAIYSYQYGNIKAKITKYTTFDYTVKYNVSATICYFKNYQWKTEKISASKSYTFNASSHVSYDTENKKILVNDKINNIIYDAEKPYDILVNIAKDKGYTNGYYFMYDYNISDIECYDHNDNNVGQSENSYIYPFFNITSNNKVIPNSKIMYKVRPFNIYCEEKYISKIVGCDEVNILQGFDFNFDLYEQNTESICKSSVDPIIEIIEKDSFVSANIVNDTILAKSNNVFNYASSMSLNDNNPYYCIDVTNSLNLSEYVTNSDNDSFFVSTTINCTKDSVKVNDKIILADSNIKIDAVCSNNVLNILVMGTLKTVTEHVVLYLPENGYYTGSVNGNAMTYQTELAGKENYCSKEKPFLIPTDAYNIVYDVEIVNTIPGGAMVTYSVTNSPNTKQWSTYVEFSSNYTESINSMFSELITTTPFNNNLIDNATKKQFKFTINKPVGDYASYYAVANCNNPNMLISYNKNIVFNVDSCELVINVISTKHPAAKWYVTAQTGYYYISGDEYYLYSDNATNLSVVDNTATINKKLNCIAPITVMNGTTSLTMVVSNYEDNISILDTIKPVVNDLYLTYTNAENVSITCDGEVVTDFTNHDNFIRLDSAIANKEYEVFYKVKDSFNYKLTEDSTIFYINSTDCSNVDVYYETDTEIATQISLNPIHSSFSEGCVYVEDIDYPIVNINNYISNYNDNYVAYFELLDANGNPVQTDVTISTEDANLNIVSSSIASDDNGIAYLNFTATDIDNNEQVNITAQNNIFTVKIFE